MQAYNAVLCGPSSKARWQEGQSVTMFCSMPLPPCERRITCATGSPLFLPHRMQRRPSRSYTISLTLLGMEVAFVCLCILRAAPFPFQLIVQQA